MRSDVHSTETKAKAEADSCLPQAGLVVWLLGMTGKKGKRAQHKGRRTCTARAGQPRRYERRERKAKRRRAAALQKKRPHAQKTSMGHPKRPTVGWAVPGGNDEKTLGQKPAYANPRPPQARPPEVRSAFVGPDRRYRAEGLRSTPLACCCDENKRMRARGGCAPSSMGLLSRFNGARVALRAREVCLSMSGSGRQLRQATGKYKRDRKR